MGQTVHFQDILNCRYDYITVLGIWFVFTIKYSNDNRNIKSHFDGVVDKIDLDVADFLNRGSTCATLLDLDPMMITGDISENELLDLTKESSVRVITNDGQEFQGQITFISASADEMMHTFDIEISIPNPSERAANNPKKKIKYILKPR